MTLEFLLIGLLAVTCVLLAAGSIFNLRSIRELNRRLKELEDRHFIKR